MLGRIGAGIIGSILGSQGPYAKDKKREEGKAHENIDNEIFKNDLNQLDPSTIERLLHKSYGDNILALYGAKTKGGEQRYIDRSLFGRLESPESLRDMDWGTRQTVVNNPNFADTLATADVPEYKQQMREMDVPLWKMLLKGILGR